MEHHKHSRYWLPGIGVLFQGSALSGELPLGEGQVYILQAEIYWCQDRFQSWSRICQNTGSSKNTNSKINSYITKDSVVEMQTGWTITSGALALPALKVVSTSKHFLWATKNVNAQLPHVDVNSPFLKTDIITIKRLIQTSPTPTATLFYSHVDQLFYSHVDHGFLLISSWKYWILKTGNFFLLRICIE